MFSMWKTESVKRKNMILVEGWNERYLDTLKQQKMIHDVQDKLNSTILGTELQKSNWLINVTKQKEIADQPMTKNHTRNIEKIEYLIDIFIDNEERTQEWVECIELWRTLIEIARKKEDFTDDEIKRFQKFVMLFLQNGSTYMARLVWETAST